MKTISNKTVMRQRRDSVTVSNMIATKTYTQNKNTGIGNRQDRDKRGTAVTTARNGSAC